jgi:hypothetical protein
MNTSMAITVGTTVEREMGEERELQVVDRVQRLPRSSRGQLTQTPWPRVSASLAQMPAGARAPPRTEPLRENDG